MKRAFLKSIVKSIVISASFFMLTSALASEEKYQFDPNHTFVVFQINHLGFSTQTGKWPANGTLILNQAHPEKSKVDVTIKINDMITGNSELNKHLEGALFFDATKFPTATYTSNKVILTSKDAATAEGVLTLHGVSKPVTLHIILNKIGKNPVNDQMSVGFSATTEINRSEFDVKGFIPAVSDAVKLNIEAEAQLQNEKAAQ